MESTAYGPEDYRFPEAYVEGVESDLYMIPDLEAGKYRLSRDPGPGLSLGRVVYEEAGDLALDVVEAVVKRHIAIRLPWEGYKALLARPGTRILVFEIGGTQTIFTVREGSRLEPRTIMGYVLTGKGETRTVRSDVEAVVFYIAWDRASHPPIYRVIAVAEEDLIVLEEAR